VRVWVRELVWLQAGSRMTTGTKSGMVVPEGCPARLQGASLALLLGERARRIV
jgi:hypothetical protein